MKSNKGFLNLPSVREEAGGAGRAWGVERWLVRRMLRAMGEPPIRVGLWDGTRIAPAGRTAVAGLMIRDRRMFWQLLANPALHFGDGYAAGRIEVEGDLVALMEAIFGARPPLHRARFPERYAVYRPGLIRRNTLAGSRDNIHHHYDLGNDFYQLWLDEELVYTCAYYPTRDASLEQAQVAKMDHVCRKLRLQPGERVIEAGCGWGALARHMARHYGVRVKAYNISREQIAEARRRAGAQGLEGQVEFIEDDYRSISGECDAFVSVGMLEHVGVDNYRGLGAVIDRCLSESGRGLIHSIGQNEPRPTNAWTARRIFPGAYPPTLRQMMEVLEPRGLSVLDVENLRLHYAKTLEHWLERFERHAAEVEALYDETFVRAWRLYLSASAANFTTGALQLFQVLFTRAHNNAIPWTRAHLYQL